MHLLRLFTLLPLGLSITSLTAAVSAQTGCSGSTHATGYHDADQAHSIVSNHTTRYYGIQVPATYNDDLSRPWPLIFDFHGRGGSPEGQRNNSRYFANPQGQEYIVVYPRGCNKAWEGAMYANRSCNDLLFVSDLLTYIEGEYCIDPDRVYASGKSNGGGFVDTLACSDTGDSFAAFAMAAAALYTDNREGGCPHQRPILESHGVLDGTVNITGNSSANGGAVPDIATWASWWAQRDGCRDPSQARNVTAQAWGNQTSYSCHGYADVVQQYRVAKLGHCWPSIHVNTDTPKPHCDIHTLDFTQSVVDFFGHWTNSNKPQ